MTTITPSHDLATPSRVQLHFSATLPGFDDLHDFALLGFADSAVYLLESLNEPAVALPVVDASLVAHDYAFDLSDADAARLRLVDQSDAWVLVVLTVPPAGSGITANLLAPIVVNRATGEASQIILDGSDYQLRHAIDAA